MMSATRNNAKPSVAVTGVNKTDSIRQSAKLGVAALRARPCKRPARRLSLLEHFKRLKGLELPPYLDE